MVKPVQAIVFVVIWRIITFAAAFATLFNATEESTPESLTCTPLEVLDGCSDLLTAYQLGTLPTTPPFETPPEINQILIFLNFVVILYLIWCVIVIIRGGAEA